MKTNKLTPAQAVFEFVFGMIFLGVITFGTMMLIYAFEPQPDHFVQATSTILAGRER